jgi:16S rRNA processing protein RimM
LRGPPKGGKRMEWVELGRIGSPYGVLGWMHIQSFTDPLEGILDYPVWSLRLGPGAQTGHRLVEGRIQGRGLVARLEGVVDRDAAALLRGAMIEVPRSALPVPGKREYYRGDLIGFTVRNLAGVELGRLDHFVDGPDTAVMVVAGTAEYWIPAIPQYLRKVDLEERGLSVDWPADAD